MKTTQAYGKVSNIQQNKRKKKNNLRKNDKSCNRSDKRIFVITNHFTK